MMDFSPESIDRISLWISSTWLVCLLAWESLHPFFGFFRERGRERLRHAGKNLLVGLINGIMISLTFVGLWLWSAAWASEHGFGLVQWLSWPGWAEAALSILLFDLWTYWWHRLNHRLPFLWRFHRMHHSDPEMDVTTANRFHLGEIALSSMLRVPVILALGAPLWHLALYEAIMFPVVQFHHANIALPAWLDRALRWVIVTPAMHKVHHSRWQPETDSNYTSMLSIWDRVFGSFRMRDDLSEIQIGLKGYDEAAQQSLKGLALTPLNPRRESES